MHNIYIYIYIYTQTYIYAYIYTYIHTYYKLLCKNVNFMLSLCDFNDVYKQSSKNTSLIWRRWLLHLFENVLLRLHKFIHRHRLVPALFPVTYSFHRTPSRVHFHMRTHTHTHLHYTYHTDIQDLHTCYFPHMTGLLQPVGKSSHNGAKLATLHGT